MIKVLERLLPISAKRGWFRRETGQEVEEENLDSSSVHNYHSVHTWIILLLSAAMVAPTSCVLYRGKPCLAVLLHR